MPPITRDQLNTMLADVPEAEHESFLTHLKSRGYTLAGAPRSDAATPAGQRPIYQPQTEIGKGAAAMEALKSPIPIVAPAANFLENTVPQALNSGADAMSKMGSPGIGQAMQGAGSTIKFAAGAIPTTLGGGMAQAAAGPLLEGAGALAGKAGPYVRPIADKFGGILADVIGALSSKDPEAIKVLANNPKAMWQKASEIFGRAHMENVIGTIEKDFKAHGTALEAIEDTLSGNFGTPSYGKAPEVMARGAFDNTKFKMAKEGFRLPEFLGEGVKSPVISKIPQDSPEYKFLVETLRDINDNPRMSFGDALRMKRNIYKAVDYGLEGANGLQPVSEDASRILKGLGKDLNKSLISSIPDTAQKQAWTRVNAEYEAASMARAELKKQVMGQSARLTEKKLTQLLREGRYDDEVMDRGAAIGAKTTARLDELRDHVAAQQFKRWGKGPSVAEGLMPSSPRLVGYGASAVGTGPDALAGIMRFVQNNPKVMNALSQALLEKQQKQQPQQPAP